MGSKLFVGNLEFKTTQDQLQELFAQAGEVRDVFLPNDRATGRPRGFAFVELSSEAEAQAAIERFDGHELNGRALRVNLAEDRPPSAARPSYGGGGGSAGGYGGGSGGGSGGGGGRPPAGRPKGSRRNLRAKKRSL